MSTLKIQRRQSGKTTELINTWIDLAVRGKEVFVISSSVNMTHHLARTFKIKCEEIGYRPLQHSEIYLHVGVDVEQIEEKIRGRCRLEDVTILVDEYLFFKPKNKKILADWSLHRKCEIIAWTTADKKYSRDEVIAISGIKYLKINGDTRYSKSIENLMLRAISPQMFDSLYFNLITCPNCRKIIEELAPNTYGMSKDTFEREILGKVWEEE